jgi:hypothetical protein
MLHFSGNCVLAAEGFTEEFAAEDQMSRFAFQLSLALVSPLAMACGGAAASKSAAAPAQEPAPVVSPSTPTATTATAALSPTERSAQVRAARAACATDAVKQQYEVVDFVTFNRLDDNNWEAVIRARQKGRLLRIGCRYDVKATTTYVYAPPSEDGGNPWGAGGPPKAPAPAVTPEPKPASSTARPDPKPPETRRAEPPKVEPKKPEPKKPEPTKPEPKPTPGASINLNMVADTSARAAIARTRDACLAEATRRRISFDDFDNFRRVAPGEWEAMLVVKTGKTAPRSCRVVVGTGKATIK